jgi:hypothetical protein
MAASPLRLAFAAMAICVALPFAASAKVAADPAGPGPEKVVSSEYKLPAKADSEVAPGVVTELWARIYRPKHLGAQPHPLVVMLHGNHATCGHFVKGVKGRVDDDISYTFTGKCPDGYVVVPSHEGYAYIATQLASWGYVVVSINANRGVTAADGVDGDEGLNLRRGRLVLRHLQQLQAWNVSGGAPDSLGFDLKGVLDFSQIGLMGHSRGGEGVLAAYTLFNDPGSPWPARFTTPPVIRGIFELAPVDGQTSRTFTADNIPWSVLLPLCDGDVSDLEGVRVFDRTVEALDEDHPAKKSVYAVWGANHNFYNSQWQHTDSTGCEGAGNKAMFNSVAAGSAKQRLTGLYGMSAFFRAHIGVAADPQLGELLNSSFDTPAPLGAVTIFERSFSESAAAAQNTVVEAFDMPSGTNTSGNPNDLSNISMSHGRVPDHDSTLRAGSISWSTSQQAPAAPPFFQSNWTQAGTGRVIGKAKTLEFRVARRIEDGSSTPTSTDFSVALVAADGSVSASRPISAYAELFAPVGSFDAHPILETVRIPLAAFGASAASQVHGVRFIFDRTQQGDIYLADIRFSRPIPAGVAETSEVAVTSPVVRAVQAPREAAASPVVTKGRVAAVRRVDAASAVEIELESAEQLPVRDALPVLRIGGKAFRVSRFPNRGATFSIAFRLSASDYAALPQGAPVVVESGRERWGFGDLDKTAP